MSTNLLERHWVWLTDLWMPRGTNRTDYVIDRHDVSRDFRDAYANAFLGRAFFTFALQFDTDDDGLTDGYEKLVAGSSPTLPDTDGDGANDYAEVCHGFNPLFDDSALDTDGDGLTDFEEVFDYQTDRNDVDSDDDGLNDHDEVVTYGTNPNDSDSDDDGLTDYDEVVLYETFPNAPDTDGDGLPDSWELTYGLDPLSSLGDDGANGDPDGDTLPNCRECDLETDPLDSDSDGDGLADQVEVGYYARTTNGIPFDCSNGMGVLPSPAASYDDDQFMVALPFPVMVAGVAATNVLVDVNGGVVFLNTNSTSSVSFAYGNADFNSFTLSNSHLSIAVYWDDLRTYPSQMPEIRLADITTNGTRYCVIEYRNIGFYSGKMNAANHATFQIAVPHDGTNTILVQYLELAGAFNGGSATIGAQAGDWSNIPVAYNTVNSVATGDVIEFHFGLGTSPILPDTDEDGLDDAHELEVGTSPHEFDTDGDGLPDGWEVNHGLDPLSSTGANGANGDPDGDHLANARELALSTYPNKDDTDEDGLTDFQEVGGVISATIPWFDISGGTDVTDLFSEADDSCLTLALTTPIIMQDTAIASVTIDINGLVYLREPDYLNTIYPKNSPRNLASYSIDSRAIVLAPFWSDMILVTNAPASKIAVGDAYIGTNRYFVIEFSGILPYDGCATAADRISFQLSLPYGGTDRAYVRYASATGETDGRNASVGIQDFHGRQKHSYCYRQANRIYSGLTLTLALGSGTNPSAADTDGDRLPDAQELALGANPLQPDTDGDGLHDGWEQAFGLDPLVHNGTDADPGNDAAADPDGDGLSNREECDWNTDPYETDTDGDGVDDGDETGQDSDPDDATDGGRPASRVPVAFTFGDHSGSHSEKYRLVLTPVKPTYRTVADKDMPKTVEWVDAEYGECETKTAMLARGFDYELRLYHVGTNEEDAPDYDYYLSLSYPASAGIVTNDPSGLICDDDTSDFFAGEGKVATLTVLDAALAADYDRDGKIDGNDMLQEYQGRVFRHWINDDDDDGDVAAGTSDMPGQGGALNPDFANCEDGHVNGRCDLLDFAPVRLDIAGMLAQLGDPSQYDFRLSQDDRAVNVVWTSLSAASANAFLKNDFDDCGESLDEKSRETGVTGIDDGKGTKIPAAFIQYLQENPDGGILMVEGIEASSKPLVFKCFRKSGSFFRRDTLVFQVEMPMRISGVEDMYRWVNLRALAANGSVSKGTATTVPANLPDSETKDVNVFFLHGFNVTENEARGWNAEMFKRFWQSGSKARFWAVAWNGDAYWPNAFHYQDNVYNAFLTASSLASFVDGHGLGTKILVAHSLGNMVVSSAIQDHGMNVSKYFMMNAAVPSEAYNPTLYNDSSTNVLVHDQWRLFVKRTWSCNWHELFQPPDDRCRLTWQGRFDNVASVTYNFYSSGDEVFELYSSGTPGPFAGSSSSLGRYSWHKQESYKGRAANVDFAWAATYWSGWGFKQASWIIGDQVIWTNCYDSVSARSIPIDALTTNTVFNLYPSSMNTNVISRLTIDEHLSKGIPALSSTAGRIPFRSANSRDNDLNGTLPDFHPNGWWRKNSSGLDNRWLHSDIKDAAYYYVFPLFDRIVDVGGMK